MKSSFRRALSICSLLMAPALASSASAAVITVTIAGNDCGNPNCIANEDGTFSTRSGLDGSPFVIKFHANGTVDEINSALFPTIDGSEFDFTPDLSGALLSGSWLYAPNDASDPEIKFWTAKGGPNYNLFFEDGGDGVADPVTSGDWSVPSGSLSHLSFYDTGGPLLLPEPLSMFLFGVAGLASAWRLRRRSKRAKV
jgi:hypothetical protein